MDALKSFWNTTDFNAVMKWIGHASRDPAGTFMNPLVFGPIVLIFALLAYPKTSGLGQKLVVGVPMVGFIVLTVAVLRNDSISHPGPFMMALLSTFMIVGWYIYTKLLRS
jgi:hypothetical protein